MKGWMWGLLFLGVGVTGYVALSRPHKAFAAFPHNAPQYVETGPSNPWTRIYNNESKAYAAAPHNAPHYPVTGIPIARFRTPVKGNTIFNRPYHTQNNHHEGDVDPYGPDLMVRQKRNNLEVYGSCSIC
jgi:hypothetical protein